MTNGMCCCKTSVSLTRSAHLNDKILRNIEEYFKTIMVIRVIDWILGGHIKRRQTLAAIESLFSNTFQGRWNINALDIGFAKSGIAKRLQRLWKD